jgi:hypothetical protein
LPGLVQHAEVGHVAIRGRRLVVERQGDGVVVIIDGVRHEASSTQPLELAW